MRNANSLTSTIESSNLSKMFGNFCVIIFNYKDEISSTKTDVDFKAVHKSIASSIKIMLDHEKSLSFNKDSSDVLYICASMADEIFLNIPWNGKHYWEENILEQKFFGTQIAGDEIFNRIDDLIAERTVLSTEKAEIYLKLLSLGFKGRYRDIEDETSHIDSYRKRLLDFIELNNSDMQMISHRLFQKEYTYTMPTNSRKLLPDTAIIGYLTSFFIFMFLVISSCVWMFETKHIKSLLQEISNIALQEQL